MLSLVPWSAILVRVHKATEPLGSLPRQIVATGIAIAEIRQRSSPPLLSVNRKMDGGGSRTMKKLRRILAALVIGAVVSLGAVGSFAQQGSNNNRPPKQKEKVPEREKQNPPSNNNQGNNNRRKP